MRRIIENGSIIQLESNGQRVEFIVNDKLGIGGSCIAYSVTYYENGTIPHKGVLKEYCPAFLESSSEFQRNGDTLIIPIELKERFNRGLELFRATYKNINDYISSNSVAMNYHPVQIGLFEGNNTLYTLSSADYGKSYDLLDDESLAVLIRIIIAVAEAVKQYHNAGYLHLDIKPKNILVLDNVTEIVKLFDYDSITPINSLKSGKSIALPMPEDYYVPELSQLRIRDVGIQTDFFEIGAMLFKRLFGYAPKPSDLVYDTSYDTENSKLLESASPSAIYEIIQLLKYTIQVSPRRRYRSDDELIKQLRKIMGMVSSDKPFLMNLPAWKPSKLCIERKKDTLEIDHRLNKDGFVFIRGIGGIGKSELVKIYVEKYGFKYHTIQFCKYVDSLKSLVASISIEGINENDYKSLDSLAKKKNRILHSSDTHTLLIVDNFNVPHDNYLREFLPLNSNSFKVIFTTRCVPAADYYEDKIMHLSYLDEEDALRLFYMHSEKQVCDETTQSIKMLLKEIQFNTLLLVLMAKVIKLTGISIGKIRELLQNQQLDSVSTRVFHEYDYSDDDIETYSRISQHLLAVYNTSNLNNDETRTLNNLTLIPPIGIEVNSFVKHTGNDMLTYDCIYNLIRLGWVELKGNKIFLQSIISDVIASNNPDRSDSYYELCEFLESQCYVDDDQHITVIQSALSIALQLDRRYINEDDSLIANISFILAMIKSYLYKPKEARNLFQKAITIEEKENDYEALTILYSQMGPFEEKFGTKTDAIYWYRKTIETAEKAQGEFTEEICSSILGIAQCYDENNQKPLALQKYIEAFSFMEQRGFLDYVRGVLERIIELLAELNKFQDIDYYAAKLNYYGGKRFSDEKYPIDNMIEFGDYGKAKVEYEKILEEMREELGEESPTYRDYAKYRWVYYLLTNDKEQAMRLIADNLSFIEDTYGKESMEMAEFLASLSYQMTDNAEFDYAIETAQRASEICISNNQTDSYIYTKSKMDLISAYVILGEYEKAQRIIEDLGNDSFSGDEYLSDMVRSVGMALLEIGEYDICIRLCKNALLKSGVDRISKMIAAEILFLYCDKCGDLDAAREYLNMIKSIVDSLSKEYAKYHMITYHRLSAKLMARETNYDEAISELSTAINMISDDTSLILLQCYIERGLYFAYLNKIEETENDCSFCETIIERYGLSDYYYIILYNNMALAKLQIDDYVSAKEYFEKIIERLPNVFNPCNYDEATICQNYGWVLFNTEEGEKGRDYIRIALDYYDKEGFGKSIDYYSALYNLLIVNNSLDDFKDNLNVAKRLYKDYSIIEELRDCVASFRISIACAIVSGLLSTENDKDAYDFANEEEEYYIKRYGKKSEERIDYLQTCAYAYYRVMYIDAFEFLNRAEKTIQKARLQFSVWEARQLNYVGIVYLDLTEKIEFGNKYINESKALFEEIGAKDDYMYPIVVKNAEYAKEKMMDKLISDMAKSIIDETEENNG